MRHFADSFYRTREAAEKAAKRWSDVYREEDILVQLECVFYVLYLPCTDDDCDHEECHQ
jgi:hypothetical protein